MVCGGESHRASTRDSAVHPPLSRARTSRKAAVAGAAHPAATTTARARELCERDPQNASARTAPTTLSLSIVPGEGEAAAAWPNSARGSEGGSIRMNGATCVYSLRDEWVVGGCVCVCVSV